jgi:hypothetical protein
MFFSAWSAVNAMGPTRPPKHPRASRACNSVVQENCGQIQPGATDKIWEDWLGFPAHGGRTVSLANLAKYPFSGTRVACVFHENVSVAEW